jgi:electron-transferring-flavoprotein dehydrogenase
VRNFHQGFEGGLWAGLLHTGAQMTLRGRDPFGDRLRSQPGHERMRRLSEVYPDRRKPEPLKADGQLTLDKLTDVYLSGTPHEEDQPVHLVVADTNLCATRCREEYGNPCQHFCPAQVYEMVAADDRGGVKLQINASNCVHCKTCDIADPYQIITWVPPEGGDGPAYRRL